MNNVAVVREVEKFVVKLLNERLSGEMVFHNQRHTTYVVKAVTEICRHSATSSTEAAILETAAWLHDVGYCYSYNGHEDSSIAVAAIFLGQLDCSPGFIDEVVACIRATKMPQIPQSALQQIICDADLFHLADADYINYAARLRREWELMLNRKYSDNEWRKKNLEMLIDHQYFTSYGIAVLQKRKLKNIQSLLNVSR